jgi:hypothetical protein
MLLASSLFGFTHGAAGAPDERALLLITPKGDPVSPGETGSPLVGDALLPPRTAKKSDEPLAGGPLGAGYWDGSEYFLGRVGVFVVFVESDGSAEPSTEDWTEEEEALVLAEIGEAMEWWAARAPGERLSFQYEVHRGVPVSCEPIGRAQREEAVWIRSALDALGFSAPNAFQGTQNLVNDFKARERLDWGFVIYVVDSSADVDGMFADGFFAYAYLGGPYMVLTLDNDGWGVENLASVCAHETGHIFYALDQYYTAHVPCDRSSGYLGRETCNSEYGSCAEDAPSCIMRSRPIAGASLSETARGQVGWADSDADGTPDVLDVPPSVEVQSSRGGVSIHLEGTATVESAANLNPSGYGHAIAVDSIRAVEVRIDEGPWMPALLEATPLSPWEKSFRVDTAPADSGAHLVLVRAVTGEGERSVPPTSLVVVAGGKSALPLEAGEPAPGLARIGIRPNPFNPSAEITIRSGGAGAASAAIYDARGAFVRLLFDGVLPGGETTLRWDGISEGGEAAPSGRYFCRVVAPAGVSIAPMILLR